MSLRATITADPGIASAYWMARLSDAVTAGDAFMATAARRQLRELGFDVQPTQARRPRRKATGARSRS